MGATSPTIATRLRTWPRWAGGVAAVALNLLVYARAIQGEFLWDDDAHITANPTIVGPLGLKEIWTSGKANYFPLTMTSFWLQHALWGLSPAPYHLVTVLFHVGCVLMLWCVLRRLAVPGAWFGAMFWGVHPVQVESVAWICELKNTQSGFFYLVAIYFFVRWIQSGTSLRFRAAYGGALVAAALAILSKSSTVMLPVVLGLIGWWQGGRRWRDAVWLMPFFTISLIASGWTIWEQKVNSMASGPEWDHGWASRLMIAGKVPWFYLGKLLWPDPLVFIYSRWDVNALSLLHFVPLGLSLAFVGVLWWQRERCRKALFIAFVYFGVSLFPVMGFFDVFFFRYSFVGDHFQYLASMGPLVLVGAIVAMTTKHLAGRGAVGAVVSGGAILFSLGAMSWQQSRIYVTREALWRDTVEQNPHAWIARMNLGMELMTTGRSQLAIPHFQAALRLKPGDALSKVNLGAALVHQGRAEEAVPFLQDAVRQMPGLPDANNNLGVALLRQGRLSEAIVPLRAAIELKPTFDGAHSNLADALMGLGRPAEALPHYETALKISPANAAYNTGAARASRALGRRTEAIHYYSAVRRVWPQDFEAASALAELCLQEGQYARVVESGSAALRVNPDCEACHFNVGNALMLLERPVEAIPHYEQALRLRPDNFDARMNLGAALYRAGRPAEAVPHFDAVLQRQPDSIAALTNLAGALQQSGRTVEAMALYARAVAAEPASIETRLNYLAALVSVGRREEALRQCEEILKRAPDHKTAMAYIDELKAASIREQPR